MPPPPKPIGVLTMSPFGGPLAHRKPSGKGQMWDLTEWEIEIRKFLSELEEFQRKELVRRISIVTTFTLSRDKLYRTTVVPVVEGLRARETTLHHKKLNYALHSQHYKERMRDYHDLEWARRAADGNNHSLIRTAWLLEEQDYSRGDIVHPFHVYLRRAQEVPALPAPPVDDERRRQPTASPVYSEHQGGFTAEDMGTRYKRHVIHAILEEFPEAHQEPAVLRRVADTMYEGRASTHLAAGYYLMMRTTQASTYGFGEEYPSGYGRQNQFPQVAVDDYRLYQTHQNNNNTTNGHAIHQTIRTSFSPRSVYEGELISPTMPPQNLYQY
eukprot:PhF_6_TR30708/c0_g1_i2/m.45185